MKDPLIQLQRRAGEAEKAARKSLGNLIGSGQGLNVFPWPDTVCLYEMRIARNGDWYHQGRHMQRKALCRLFSTLLQKDDLGRFWLVTPAEKGMIEVEDAPFTAVEMKVEGQGKGQILSFRSNLDHQVRADAAHPIRVAINLETQEPSPYLLVRDDLEALIIRSVFYELVNLAEEVEMDGQVKFGVWSAGLFFELGTPA